MVELNKYLKGRGRSSVSVDKQLRRVIDDLKEQIERATGTSVTDVDFMYRLLESYDFKADLLSIAKQIIETTQELIVSYEDYLKLKEEVEQLRKENEELREELKKQTIVHNAREAFKLFVKMVTQEAEQQLSKETQDHLLSILTELHGIFNGDGLNWERIKEIAKVIR